MANQNLPISGLHPLTGALTSNDLMVISQEQPEGWQSFHVEVSKFVDLVISGMNDGSVFLRKVHTIDSSGLIGSGTIPDALGLDWDYLRTQFAPNGVGDSYVSTTTRVIAGAGLVGGGALNTDRTITLGIPSTLTATTLNGSNGDTHTHELSKASTTVAGVVKLVDNTNSDSVTEAVTAKVAKNLATTKADKNIALTAGAGLTGGGDLSAGRTISLAPPGTLTETSTNTASVDTHTHRINPATKDSAGIVRIDDVLDSSSTSVAASSRAVKLLNDNKVEKGITINAGSGLTGGGNLNYSRTLQVDFNTLDARYALSGVGGSYVPLTRTIATGTGLTGGGDLSANRTIGISFGASAGTVAMGNDSRINNGQTAHGWGDHGSRNYLTLVQTAPAGGLLGNGTVATPLKIDYTELGKLYLSKKGGTIEGDLTVTGAVNIAGGAPATLLANQFMGSQKIVGDLEVTGNVKFGFLTDLLSLKDPRGYQQLPGGLILQWGRTVAVPDKQSRTIPFNIAFPKRCFNVQLTESVSSPASNHTTTVAAYGETQTEFTMSTRSTLSGISASCFWLAIGE